MIYKVEFTKHCAKQLKKVPGHVLVKLETWISSIELQGLEETRRIPGYHDELLKGKRDGQRSIRLNKAWRAIYIVKSSNIEFVEVQEVTHHDYR
ncbi:MAG: hypothetical protein BWY41_00050 [Candidatus Atribacteria bacterium ADurb.Bin276]|uniref:Plasmid maintenance system killer protein n=1 Tax=Candidatus Atribacter allofermentans TaxID=1852833 RepID=A0A1V5T526_9BACT|nr:MAG: hypothetical protein BWY41_00050 [Candidatus Atribacteria bacterium ADurb.Bin276]